MCWSTSFILLFQRFRRDDTAVAAVEAGMIFPLLIIILCGMMDTGAGLVVNQKMITSCQTVADILAREDSVTDPALADAVAAGRLSLVPYETATFGVHVAGIQFTGSGPSPVIRWQDMINTDPNPDVVIRAAGLGALNEGVLAITTRYTYQPFFSGTFTGDIDMEEVAYVRGRRGLYIPRVRG